MSNSTYAVCGKSYPITGYQDVRVKGTGKTVSIPIVDIPMMRDYKWQLDCLTDRLNNPEKYAPFEDVPEVITKLEKWLAEHQPE